MPKSKSSAKKGRVSMPILVAIIATVFLIMFIVVALLLEPQPSIPTFSITDQNGDWDAQSQGKIAVFDDLIEPGAKDKYQFIIKNDSDANLEFGFRLTEYLDGINCDANPFMMYRIKMNNDYVGDGEWHYVGVEFNGIEIISGSEHLMTLEWWWPFEIDEEHDANDTLIGVAGGKLSVHIFIWAEVVEEPIW